MMMRREDDYGITVTRTPPFRRRRYRDDRYRDDDVPERQERPGAGRDGHSAWEGRTRVVLTPIAAPSILGLFGFMGATLIVAANMAGWYGNSTTSQMFLFPFALTFGGIAQLLAGMWSYKARDSLATAVHGTWGSFWIGYGIMYAFGAAGAFTIPTNKFPELGFWFIVLAAITWVAAAAAIFENIGLFSVLVCLAAGSTLAAIGLMTGTLGITRAAGWVLAFSAFFAWYTASAMMLEGMFRRVVLPLGKWKVAANVPGHTMLDPIEYPDGMPGVRAGQ